MPVAKKTEQPAAEVEAAGSTVEQPGVPGLPAHFEGLSSDERLALMRAPFAAVDMGKLPKPVKRDDQDKGWCEPSNPQYSADGYYCHGRHSRSLHLDFVGHAAITNRLLEVDPHWNWEPMAEDAAGLPAFDQNGGLWIKLTVQGVTRPGYGDADGKRGGSAVKEAIGDAIRNAAMRFGAGLALWHKGDLSAEGTLEAAAGGGEMAEGFIARAEQAKNRDDATAIWTEARDAGVDQKVLDTISGASARAVKAAGEARR